MNALVETPQGTGQIDGYRPAECQAATDSNLGMTDHGAPSHRRGRERSGRGLDSDSQLDHMLMARVGRGDEAALRLLLDRYWDDLIQYAAGFLGDLDSAEDVIQEAFIRVWRGRMRWTPSGTVQSYLYRIVRNLALQEMQQRAARRRRSEVAEVPAAVVTPADELELQTRSVALNRALNSLPPRRREIVILLRFHGLSHKQAAEAMGISVQTVANQMSSAFVSLRETLSRQPL